MLVAILGIGSVVNLFNEDGDAVVGMISAAAFGFEIVILVISVWFILQKALGHEPIDLSFTHLFADWHLIPVIGLALAGLTAGGLAAYSEIPWLGWLIMPFSTILVIVPPIWLLFGYGSRGLDAGPRWRVFAVLGMGMTIGPVIMVILELVTLTGIIVAGVILLAVLEPATFQELMRLSDIVQTETNPDVLLSLFAPYISNPFAIATGIGYIALIVPLIEELLKPLAVWLFASKIESPTQGFVLGLISGAAFALIESLNASADGTTSWPVIVSCARRYGHSTYDGFRVGGLGNRFCIQRETIWAFFRRLFFRCDDPRDMECRCHRHRSFRHWRVHR
ncbi:MAG: PrsW family intramembrane metalloprotease [Lewinellaceae bacterium]|nr:PrsW family intramembrane metalloprotease [Lewinellaceae bacterium]